MPGAAAATESISNTHFTEHAQKRNQLNPSVLNLCNLCWVCLLRLLPAREGLV
jgi:hypothetical protein